MRRKNSGSAFVVSLAVLVVLGIVVATFSSELTVTLNAQRNRLDQARARRMAESGLQHALTSLLDQDINVTASTDLWATLGTNGDEAFRVGANGAFRIQVLDAGGFLNANSITLEQWERIGLEPDTIDAILDWREEGFQPRPQGAKDEFYNGLATPYNTKLRDFDLIDELLLVRGMTPAILYRPLENTTNNSLVSGSTDVQPALYDLLTVDSAAPNVRADGSARINANNATVQQLTQAGMPQNIATAVVAQRNTVGTFQNLGQVIATPGMTLPAAQIVLDALTITAEPIAYGKLNLNSVSEAVLQTFPDLTTDVIASIISRQGTYASVGELATVAGVTVQNLVTIADAFTVGSQAFVVRVLGSYSSTQVALEAVIVIEDGRPRIKKIQPCPFVDPITKWGWADETTTETVLLEAA